MKKASNTKNALKRLKKYRKRLTLRKTENKPEKWCTSVENRKVNKKNQKKIQEIVEKAKKKA